MENAARVHSSHNDLRPLPVVVKNGDTPMLGQVAIKPDRTACWMYPDATICLYMLETTTQEFNGEDMCVARSVLIVHVVNASVSTTTQDQTGAYGLLDATYVLRGLQLQVW